MLATRECEPCAAGVPPLSESEINAKMAEVPGWELTDDKRHIERRFKFHDFVAALLFVNKIGNLAEEQGHHPDICFGYGYCRITFQTHATDGLHDNDFIMAAKVNELAP